MYKDLLKTSLQIDFIQISIKNRNYLLYDYQ